ncbi:hypothetical protein [Gordonia alkaliphila]|uniref:hypothetical protein n=1 Tax=Gordonia alkaliphila TaxID=1053547 RepID=UPI0031EFBCB0
MTEVAESSLAGVRPVVRLDAAKVAKAVTSQVGEAVAAASAEHQLSVAASTEAAAQRLESATATADRLSRALTWQGVGRVAAAAVPVALVLLSLALLTVPLGQLLGIGPLSQWAWDSFTAAGAWWSRLLIAVATLGVVGAAGYGVFRAGQSLHRVYRGW